MAAAGKIHAYVWLCPPWRPGWTGLAECASLTGLGTCEDTTVLFRSGRL